MEVERCHPCGPAYVQVDEQAYSYYAPYNWKNQPHPDNKRWNPNDGEAAPVKEEEAQPLGDASPAELAKPTAMAQKLAEYMQMDAAEGAYSYYSPYHWNLKPHADLQKWNPGDGFGEPAPVVEEPLVGGPKGPASDPIPAELARVEAAAGAQALV